MLADMFDFAEAKPDISPNKDALGFVKEMRRHFLILQVGLESNICLQP